MPTIDLDGGKQDEIVLSTEGIIQYAFGTYKSNDVRGNIFEATPRSRQRLSG